MKFRVSIVTAAVMASLSLSAQANEQEKEVEVIQISGIKGSLVKSMNNKRFAYNVVDTISAEDIGKFPDSNLAESLQRITGVSIDRSGGEGQFVSIRGMGPDFSSVTLNGREVASESQTRAFGFDTLASELVSNIDVNKTSTAEMLEGGIGGNINIRTAQPFDFEEFFAAGSIEGVREQNRGEITPQGSFLVTDRFMDDRLGLLASFTYQNREAQSFEVNNDGIIQRDIDLYAHRRDVGPDDGWRKVIGVAEGLYSHQAIGRGVTLEERQRVGGNLAVQFQASNDLILSADYLYSKLDVDSVNNQAYNWFWATHSMDVVDDNNTVLRQTHADGYSGYAHLRFEKHRPSTTEVLGLNADWIINDRLSLKADLAWSEAENNNRGLDSRQTLEALNQPGIILDYTSGQVPSMIHVEPETTLPVNADLSDLQMRHMERYGDYTKAENNQLRFDFSYLVDGQYFHKIDFGAHYLSKSKQNVFYQTPQDLIKMYQNSGARPVATSAHAMVRDYGNVFPANDLSAQFFELNEDAMWALANDPASLAMLSQNPDVKQALLDLHSSNGGFTARATNNAYEIEEDVTSFYVDGYFNGDIGDMTWTVLAGLRYSKTEQTSNGTMQTLVGLDKPVEMSVNLVPRYDGFSAVAIENDYDNWLPSISGNLNITDKLIVRAGVSKTITRPTLTDLAPSLSVSSTTTDLRTARGSNPMLSPFESTNFDLSLEYYYDEASMASLAYFRKSVDNFIVRTNSIENFDLEFGEQWSDFDVNRPRNGESATVDGIEANWIHTLDSGFGMQINATFVDSNAELDNTNPDQVFALEGLSDTANAVLFYEKGPYQFRIAYNLRGEFLETQINPYAGEPIYVDDYEQVDISGSYEINENMSVYFEGINITESTVDKHGRFDNHFIYYGDYGARYAVGVRASF
ncbi:TonB-dependent receptor [Lacimicrobium sp. SS2-24]|uniref:TonB-dependent receptor n=1 Tax=Lacimicrobium sp. SS2-24 TaxID=2005569 RepID=UPI000B4BB038|nr:TonB-dependent receptor [Lacimicrobium sp. SS2-24]